MLAAGIAVHPALMAVMPAPLLRVTMAAACHPAPAAMPALHSRRALALFLVLVLLATASRAAGRTGWLCLYWTISR